MSMDRWLGDGAMSDWPFVGRDAELAAISALAADADVSGVLLDGPAGVGKTRLARQTLAVLAANGWHTEWVTASRAAASIPFGAVAHLLPNQWRSDGHPMTVVRAVAAHVRGWGGRRAIAVDDAHLLDDASATVVGHLTVSRAAFTVMTARTGALAPDAVMTPWKDGTARRLDLPGLSDADVDQLLDRALGGEVDGVSRRRLHRAADGNPLTLRELIRSGLDGQTLRQRYGVWRWDPGAALRSPVAGLVPDRLWSVAPAVRLVLELVALGAPLPLAALESLADAAAIQAAEDGGMIVVERAGARVQVRLARPLCAEAVRVGVPLWRARRCYQRLASAALAMPMRRRDDALRAAVWQVASGVVTDPGVVASGARQALRRLDVLLAERLARATRDAAPGAEADWLLAEILLQRGCQAEAAAILRSDPPPPEEIDAGDWVSRAVTRAVTLYASDEAAAQQVRRMAADGPDAEQADGAWSRILLLDGRCAESYAVAGRVLNRPGAGDQAVLWAATAATAAAGFLGRSEEAMRAYGRGVALAAGRGDTPLWGVVELGYAGCLANLASGDLRLAGELADEGYREAVEADASSAAGGWAALRGMVAAAQGRLAVAGKALREAVAALEDNDALRLVRLCLACLGAVTALAGDPAAACGWLEQADRRPGQGDRLFAPWVEQWRAWAIVNSRSTTAAVAVAEAAAQLARVAQLPTVETAALYDVVRLGGGLRPRLDVVATGLRTPLADTLVIAAGGLTNADADALAHATATFDGLGHDLLAAEVATAAGLTYRRCGRRGSAQVYVEKAALLRARCAGVRTPLLDADGITELLTPREREVLLLAAGHTSPQIAQRLGLSPRTVDNNLNRAYAKLGVSGRHELRALLPHDAPPFTRDGAREPG